MLGEYDNGLGQRWQDAHPIRFFNEGPSATRISPTACGS
jgi:hypothetical protein